MPPSRYFDNEALTNFIGWCFICMSGIVLLLAGCKSLYTPIWREVLANGKGVAGDCKSERSHQQNQRSNGQKLDIRLTSRGWASNGLRSAQKSNVSAYSKSSRTWWKSISLSREVLQRAPTVQDWQRCLISLCKKSAEDIVFGVCTPSKKVWIF